MPTDTNDRVNFSYSFKLPGPVEYSSLTASCSYSTDLQPDETPEEAMARARTFVMAEIEKDYDAIRNSDSGGKDDSGDFQVPKKKSKASKKGRDRDEEDD